MKSFYQVLVEREVKVGGLECSIEDLLSEEQARFAQETLVFLEEEGFKLEVKTATKGHQYVSFGYEGALSGFRDVAEPKNDKKGFLKVDRVKYPEDGGSATARFTMMGFSDDSGWGGFLYKIFSAFKDEEDFSLATIQGQFSGTVFLNVSSYKNKDGEQRHGSSLRLSISSAKDLSWAKNAQTSVQAIEIARAEKALTKEALASTISAIKAEMVDKPEPKAKSSAKSKAKAK
jgi:hypothetical protein